MQPLTPEQLGRVLRELREQRHLKLEEAAELADIKPATLSRHETGKTGRITYDDAMKLAKAYELTPEVFAAIAGYWLPSDIPSENAEIDKLANRVRNLLLELPEQERDKMSLFFEKMVTVERQLMAERRQEEEASALPHWLGEREMAGKYSV